MGKSGEFNLSQTLKPSSLRHMLHELFPHPMPSFHSVVAGIGHLVESNISPDGNLQSLVSLLHQNAFTWVESLFLPLSLLLPSEMPGYSPE